jgi:fructose-1,6-bisphosphatase
MERPLFCIVADKNAAASVRPDLNSYTPKQLADKEQVSLTSVYNWIKEGLPIMRQGKRGNIKIHYQDYVNWMIDCAKDDNSSVAAPAWAYWCVRAKV